MAGKDSDYAAKSLHLTPKTILKYAKRFGIDGLA